MVDEEDRVVDELVDATVKVPRGRLADFYARHARWLDDLDAGRGGADGSRPPGAWDPDGDLELAIRAWTSLPERARALLSTLIDNPDRRYWGEQLAELNGIPNGKYGIAGTLAWPGRKLKPLGRPLPIESEPDPRGGSTYWMTPAMARLFAEARRAAEAG